MVDDRSWKVAWRRNVKNDKGKLAENRHWEGGDCRDDGVSVDDNLVPAQAGVSLGRVLNRLQVVSDGDDWKQN